MRPQFKHERDEVQAEIVHDAYINACDCDVLTLDDGASRAFWEEQRPERKKFVNAARNWCDRNPPAKQARARQRGDEQKNANTVNITHRSMRPAPLPVQQRIDNAAFSALASLSSRYKVSFE